MSCLYVWSTLIYERSRYAYERLVHGHDEPDLVLAISSVAPVWRPCLGGPCRAFGLSMVRASSKSESSREENSGGCRALPDATCHASVWPETGICRICRICLACRGGNKAGREKGGKKQTESLSLKFASPLTFSPASSPRTWWIFLK